MDRPRESIASSEPTASTNDRISLDGSLKVYSRRTERQRKKQIKKLSKEMVDHHPPKPGIFALPYEIIVDILSLLRPSDLFRLSRTSHALQEFVTEQQGTLAHNIITWRYPSLQKCLRPPVLLDNVDSSLHPLLQNKKRQGMLDIHRRPYQHIQPFDPAFTCTCLTCILQWNALCLVVDFAYWQHFLERGEPIKMYPRGGQPPPWNEELIARNAHVVINALHNPLWYACILEAHLNSTILAIRRHSQNKGNKRKRFDMTREDSQSGTDSFLERKGPPTMDFPFHRDNYYMLETFLPNRGWNGDEGRWMYVPVDQHAKDLEMLRRMQGSSSSTVAD
jgi:hypothetical protein